MIISHTLPSRFEDLDLLRGLGAAIIPVFIEKIVGVQISFEQYSLDFAYSRLIPGRGAVNIYEHRFFVRDADNNPYNFPTTRNLPNAVSSAAYWRRPGPDQTGQDSYDYPFFLGAPPAGNVFLGPATRVSGVRLEIENLTVAPSYPVLEDQQVARSLSLIHI